MQIKIQPENMPLTGKVEPSTKTVDTQNKINKIEAENGVRFKFEISRGIPIPPFMKLIKVF